MKTSSNNRKSNSKTGNCRVAGANVHTTFEKVLITLNGEDTTIVVNHLEDPVFRASSNVISMRIVLQSGDIVETDNPEDYPVFKHHCRIAKDAAENIWEDLKDAILDANIDGGDFDSLQSDLRRLCGAIRHCRLDKDVKGELLKLIYWALKTGGLRKLYRELKDLQEEYYEC